MDKKEKLSILVIEDNGMFLSIAEQMLSGHNVIPVKTAKEGLLKFKSEKPNMVFLDISLPDGTGHELLKEMKTIDPEAYVIMLTSSRLREDVISSMDAGAQGYIIKPFSSGILEQSITEYYQHMEK